MPLPGRRLDLHLVPPDPEDRPRELADLFLRDLVHDGVIEADGRAGPRAAAWVAGGFGRVRIDDPGHVVLYANQQGGFRVRCPACDANLVPTFNAALSEMRRGGERRCACPACGAGHALEDLRFAPPAAFGRLSIVTVDVEDARLTEAGARWVADRLGPWRVVLRRP